MQKFKKISFSPCILEEQSNQLPLAFKEKNYFFKEKITQGIKKHKSKVAPFFILKKEGV